MKHQIEIFDPEAVQHLLQISGDDEEFIRKFFDFDRCGKFTIEFDSEAGTARVVPISELNTETMSATVLEVKR